MAGLQNEWEGSLPGVQARVKNMEDDNLSLKIPHSLRHPAEAGVWPGTIHLQSFQQLIDSTGSLSLKYIQSAAEKQIF